MARRSRRDSPEVLRSKLVELLEQFEEKLTEDDLRAQVKELIPVNYLLRDLGSSLIKDDSADSAAERMLCYLRKYPRTLVQGDELMVVAGISEYGRRLRELRVQKGWPIYSGESLKVMFEDGDHLEGLGQNKLSPDTYYLSEDNQDREAAYRWILANVIRKSSLSVKAKILEYLRKNAGHMVTGEELKYLAKDRSEWARRSRELRTEEGWPIMTRVSGMPELPVGAYLLLEDRQAPAHDRTIPDPVRVKVLERDKYTCKKCTWSHSSANPSDRYRTLLELHHITQHAYGGENSPDNLITLCNVCHDDIHRKNDSPDELRELIA